MHKYYVTFPSIGFNHFLDTHLYNELKRPFYESNMSGFAETDILEENSIWVNEFDLDAIPEAPYADTPPEEIKKHLVDDYLLPLLVRTKNRTRIEILTKYQKIQNYGDTAILNLKDALFDEMNELIYKAKEAKHLPPKVKPQLLSVFNGQIKFIEENIHTNFVIDQESKIKLRLGIKDICHLILFLNEHNLFEKKLKKNEIAKMIEQHFQSQVGAKDTFKVITNAANILSNSLNSPAHGSLNPKLDKILVNLNEVLNKIPKG